MSAIATLLSHQNEIQISARLYFYGSEATDELAAKIVQEINTMYNEANAQIMVAGRSFQVRFEVEYALIFGDELVQLAVNNRDYRNNFIRLEKQNTTTRSFMGFGLGDNAGHWITSDQLGVSTTAAHEFGHSLGLDHPLQTDFRGSDAPPPIMAPRGTWVLPHYQWNPLVAAGEYGGTMNPIHRKVSVAEIQEVLANARFSPEGVALIGQPTNALLDEMGGLIQWLA